MRSQNPRITVGLPVYNGARFLRETIESILSQTYVDFELVISDNASTDGTQEIGRAYAEKDQRIRYVRNKTNLGASKNFNSVFDLSSGEYFKWAAHDDVCAPNFLLRCVEILDREPSVVLCYPRQIDIEENGQVLRENPYELNTNLATPQERFAEVIRFWRGAPAIWGVIRRGVLKKTPLIGYYYASDLVLLAELALYGQFYEVPEDLLFHRDHQSRSVYDTTRHSVRAWLDPTKAKRITFPMWRWFLEYLLAIRRAPLSWSERRQCYLHAARWFRWHWNYAKDDLNFFATQILHPILSRRETAK